jgi:UDP-glucose 4-epimerase
MDLRTQRKDGECLRLGGGGFVGALLYCALHARGHSVRVFDRPLPKVLAAKHARGSFEWIYGDLLNKNEISTGVAGCDVDFHLISTTLPGNSNENPLYDVQTNLVGAER